MGRVAAASADRGSRGNACLQCARPRLTHREPIARPPRAVGGDQPCLVAEEVEVGDGCVRPFFEQTFDGLAFGLGLRTYEAGLEPKDAGERDTEASLRAGTFRSAFGVQPGRATDAVGDLVAELGGFEHVDVGSE